MRQAVYRGIYHENITVYSGVIMGVMASQITGVSIFCSTVCSGGDQRKHQSSASLAFVRGIHRWPVNSPHKRPVSREMFPFFDVIMNIFDTIHTLCLPMRGKDALEFSYYVKCSKILLNLICHYDWLHVMKWLYEIIENKNWFERIVKEYVHTGNMQCTWWWPSDVT